MQDIPIDTISKKATGLCGEGCKKIPSLTHIREPKDEIFKPV